MCFIGILLDIELSVITEPFWNVF